MMKLFKHSFWIASALMLLGCNEQPQVPVAPMPAPQVIPAQIFKGGVASNNLDLRAIRFGKTAQRERLVFDSFLAGSARRAFNSGTYLFKYDRQNHRIIGAVTGYQAVSAFNRQKLTFAKSQYIGGIRLVDRTPYATKFAILLRSDADVNIFELKNPGKIVVDITPATNSMPMAPAVAPMPPVAPVVPAAPMPVAPSVAATATINSMFIKKIDENTMMTMVVDKIASYRVVKTGPTSLDIVLDSYRSNARAVHIPSSTLIESVSSQKLPNGGTILHVNLNQPATHEIYKFDSPTLLVLELTPAN